MEEPLAMTLQERMLVLSLASKIVEMAEDLSAAEYHIQVKGAAMSSANKERLGYVGRKPGSRDSNSWFTPESYIDMVRDVLGEIELDPFSCTAANKTIKAKRFFSEKHSAFDHEWDAATVFMNPPYSARLVALSVDRFLVMLDRYGFDAIVLVNNATETRWFQALLRRADAVCFPDHRIAFSSDDGKSVSGNTRGQAFLYFGTCRERFLDVFSIGIVAVRMKRGDL